MRIRLALFLMSVLSVASDCPVRCCGRRPVCACHRQRQISRRRSAAEGADQRRPRRRRRTQARRFQCRNRRKPDRRADAPRLRQALRTHQARVGRAAFLQRIRRPVGAPELYDPGRRPDLDRAGCPPRWLQPRDGTGRNQQPRRRRQDRPDRRQQAQPVRAPVPQLFGRLGAGHRAERHAGDVFGSAQLRRWRQWRRSQPVRAGIAQGNPRSRPDGRGNPQPHPRRRHPRVAQRAGAVDFVVAGRGFLVHSGSVRHAAIVKPRRLRVLVRARVRVRWYRFRSRPPHRHHCRCPTPTPKPAPTPRVETLPPIDKAVGQDRHGGACRRSDHQEPDRQALRQPRRRRRAVSPRPGLRQQGRLRASPSGISTNRCGSIRRTSRPSTTAAGRAP